MKWVRSCHACQQFGRSSHHAQLRSFTYDSPFKMVALDVLGPFHVDSMGRKYVLFVIDLHNRYVELCILPQADIQTSLKTLPEMWPQRWGLPTVIMTDAAPSFKGANWIAFYRAYDIQHLPVAPYMQRTNGVSERSTQTLPNIIQRLLRDQEGTWSTCRTSISMSFT